MQAAAKAAAEANLALATIQFAAMEKFAQLNASAAKTAMENSLAYAKGVYETALDPDSETSKIAERHLSEAGKELHKARRAA
jgi:division protein CdvB (Snf7/Vps24/ESCRT-III family)